MRISININKNSEHQRIHAEAFVKGAEKHGVETVTGKYNQDCGADACLVWTWRQYDLLSKVLNSGRHAIVMERGFFQPRREWCSIAVDGFNGLGKFPQAADSGERFVKNFGHMLKPWRPDTGQKRALLIGQVPGDAAIYGNDLDAWAQSTADILIQLGWKVLYRPHPVVAKKNRSVVPVGTNLIEGSLEEAFESNDIVVCFNSTTAVEAVLYGIPTVTMHPGSVARDVTSHDLQDPLFYPERSEWCRGMAWKNWTLEEIESGYAFENIRPLLS